MIQTDLSVTAEINLYYDLFVPEDAPKNAPLLITIHGYAAHKRYMMREARLIAPENFVIVSLQAPNKFWRETKGGEFKPVFGWLTDYKPEESVALHHKFILDVIGKLSSDGIINKDQVFLHGFSQACALNFRFAFTHPESLKGIIGICGGIPSDLDTNEIYKPINADVLYLYGDEDVFYPLEKFQRFEKKLDGFLPNFQSIKYSAKHEITDEMREDMLRFLLAVNS
jgi:phospholipase/carboxylesterase